MEGAFEIVEGVVVELRNLPEVADRTYVKILEAGEFAGTWNLPSAVFTGVVPGGVAGVSLVVRQDGGLYARLTPQRGLLLKVR